MKSKNFSFTNLLCLIMLLSMSSCLDETFPKNGTATADQVARSEKGVKALTNSIIGYINKHNSYGVNRRNDIGYSGYGIYRDIMCEDYHIYNTTYDYFPEYGSCSDVGPNTTVPVYIWSYYYKLLAKANGLIYTIEQEKETPELNNFKGVALTVRSLVYMDLVRMYEYRKTGVGRLDAEADRDEIWGLTVPIIDYEMTEEEARNNPRAPFYTMYAYIFDNLDQAESLLTDYQRERKDMPDVSVVYGMKARMWLELGSRFTKYPNDLSTMLQHVNLGISSAIECYTKAAEYARKAIDISGARPLSESEWYGGDGYLSAFNTISVSSWMWGTILTKEYISNPWLSYAAHVFTEQYFGVGGLSYGAYRIIGNRLFDEISNADWRKTTWIAPEDAGKEPAGKYKTILTDSEFKRLPAYVSLKYKPRDGNVGDGFSGPIIDYCLMRVEEMYFIEAEALAKTGGVGAGISALESFMNTYRYKTDIQKYECKATTPEEYQKELLRQKRIEFWGEGIIYWDYKRLELQVVRGYPGTNSYVSHRLNSIEGYCAPWFNIAISFFEENKNKEIELHKNPDPSKAIEEWRE